METIAPVKSRVSDKVNSIAPSGIRAFFELVIGMDDVISLGVGEPDFKTPQNVRDLAIREIQAGKTTYTSNWGLMDLRVGIAEWLNKHYGSVYNPENEILITVGASEAIDLALRAMLNPGDEVIVVEPCYVSYAPTVTMAGGVPILFPTWQKDNFRVNMEELEKVVTPKTRAIMLNYPSNPTGATMNESDLNKLAEFLERHDLILLSDEIYAELTYDMDHVSISAFERIRDRVILLSGFSKSHAMTGWRVGYACGPEDIIAAMVKIHQFTMLCAPTVSQQAALEALRNSDDAVVEMRNDYRKRRDLIVAGLNRLNLKTLVPEGAFYSFSNIESTGMNSMDFCMELLKEEKVAVVPGTAFGSCGEGFIRACYASSTTKIEQALAGMESFLNRRK